MMGSPSAISMGLEGIMPPSYQKLSPQAFNLQRLQVFSLWKSVFYNLCLWGRFCIHQGGGTLYFGGVFKLKA